MLTDVIINGILLGSVYGIASIGFALIFGVMQMLNIAYGDLIILGAYIAFWMFRLYNFDPFLSVPLNILFLFIVGLVIMKVFFSYIIKVPHPGVRFKNSLLVSFGLTFILQNIYLLIWTSYPRILKPSYFGETLSLFGLTISVSRLGVSLVSFALVFLLYLFLNKTDVGLSIRMTAEDWEAATLMGVNVTRIYLIAFGIGAGLAGAAGPLLGMLYMFDPAGGLRYTSIALVVVTLGGLGSVMGAFAGGLLLGIIESIGAFYFGGEYRLLIGFIVFIVVIMVRPHGIFGKKHVR